MNEHHLIFMLGLFAGILLVVLLEHLFPWLVNTYWFIKEIIRTRGKILKESKSSHCSAEMKDKMESLNFHERKENE